MTSSRQNPHRTPLPGLSQDIAQIRCAKTRFYRPQLVTGISRIGVAYTLFKNNNTNFQWQGFKIHS